MNPLRPGLLWIVLCAVWCGLASPASAQSDTAAATGNVRDSQGGAITGAAVALRNIDTGLVRDTETTGEGRFWIAGLPPGRYELTAERTGFRTVVRSGLTLTLGADAVLDVELSVSGVSDTVLVTADVPIVETTSAAIELRMNRSQLDLLPLFGRDYLSLLRLTPASQDFGDSFTGSRERSNEYTLDGVDNTSDISGFSRSSIALDAIQEFQVLANSYKAENGRASGGVINVVTRSGTNRPSGSAVPRDERRCVQLAEPVRESAGGRTTVSSDRRRAARPAARWSRIAGTTSWRTRACAQDAQTEATQVMPASTAAFSAATRSFLAANGIPLSIFGDGGQVRQVRPEYLDSAQRRRARGRSTRRRADVRRALHVQTKRALVRHGRDALRLQRRDLARQGQLRRREPQVGARPEPAQRSVCAGWPHAVELSRRASNADERLGHRRVRSGRQHVVSAGTQRAAVSGGRQLHVEPHRRPLRRPHRQGRRQHQGVPLRQLLRRQFARHLHVRHAAAVHPRPATHVHAVQRRHDDSIDRTRSPVSTCRTIGGYGQA